MQTIIGYHIVAPGTLWVYLANGEHRPATEADRRQILNGRPRPISTPRKRAA